MNVTLTNIIVNTSFIAIHAWPECNVSGVEYLKDPHRHKFTVQVKLEVKHNNRDIEFIDFKKKLDTFLDKYRNNDIGNMSCEDICDAILDNWDSCIYVQVLEDGENGAEKIREIWSDDNI